MCWCVNHPDTVSTVKFQKSTTKPVAFSATGFLMPPLGLIPIQPLPHPVTFLRWKQKHWAPPVGEATDARPRCDDKPGALNGKMKVHEL